MTAGLQPMGLLENLRGSYDVFIAAQFGTQFSSANGAAIDYAGTVPLQGTELAALKEWIEPSLLGPARPDPGVGRYGATAGDWLQRLVVILQVNIFSRPRRQSSARRLQQLRDLVVSKMYPGMTVPVIDLAGASAALGAMVLRRVSMDQAVGLGEAYEDLEQWTYSVDAAWTEHVRLS